MIPAHFDHVQAGQLSSRELSAVIYCHFVVRGELRPGILFTADAANAAIDWWNALNQHEQASFEATLARPYLY